MLYFSLTDDVSRGIPAQSTTGEDGEDIADVLVQAEPFSEEVTPYRTYRVVVIAGKQVFEK